MSAIDPFSDIPRIVNNTELKSAKSIGGSSSDIIHPKGVPPILSTIFKISSAKREIKIVMFSLLN